MTNLAHCVLESHTTYLVRVAAGPTVRSRAWEVPLAWVPRSPALVPLSPLPSYAGLGQRPTFHTTTHPLSGAHISGPRIGEFVASSLGQVHPLVLMLVL